MNVGFTTPRLSTIFSTRPSIAVAKPQASWAESSTLPNECAIGSHRNCRSSSCRMSCDVDRLALVDPGAVPQPDALGPAGRAGGVDQRRELVGLDGGDRRLDGAGVLDEVLLAEVGERVQGDHPVAVALAVDGDDLLDRGELAAPGGELGELGVVLDEDDLALGVAEDVRRVLLVRRGVDRGRGATGAHDREVGEDPLVAGARGDADPLLGLDPEREQSCGEVGDPVAGLLPGDRLPGVADRVAERLVAAGSWPPGRRTSPPCWARGCRRSWCRG